MTANKGVDAFGPLYGRKGALVTCELLRGCSQAVSLVCAEAGQLLVPTLGAVSLTLVKIMPVLLYQSIQAEKVENMTVFNNKHG